MTRRYLDHASAAPLRPGAFEAMLPFLRDHHADPGRLHAEGRTTRVALETAREQVAALIGARPREVVFTSGGTEAANAAVHGAIARAVERGGAPHVVLGAIEHSCVREAAERSAAHLGGSITVVGCDAEGTVDSEALADAVRADTALVALQVANHEVGTIQPVAEAVAAVRAAGARLDADPLVLADAASAVGHVPVDLGPLGVDLAIVSAHKFGGPKGAGAMFVRRGLRVPPLLLGGAQERARRAGLEAVATMVGFGAAAAEVAGTLDAEADRNATQCDRIAADATAVDGVVRMGPGDAARRLPHLVCLTIEGVEAEPILLALDQRGIAVHSGSACSSETLEPSPVLLAMGADADRSLRVSVGWSTTDEDAEAFGPAFADALTTLRALRN